MNVCILKLSVAAAIITLSFSASPSFASHGRGGDFNGDGYTDLAIGAPGESVDGVGSAGAVHVLYGSAAGLTAAGNQLWTQNSAGIQNTCEELDNFGNAVVSGDFNGDGYDDLAIGVRREDIGAIVDAGAVHVLYGSPSGLTSTGAQFWHENVEGIAAKCQDQDWFGSALAAGDFNNNGRSDLAIGVPGKLRSGFLGAGAVHVLYGHGAGLTSSGSQLWSQNTTGILGDCAIGDHFGDALAAGSFDGNGRDDLAIGIPQETVAGVFSAGAVAVLYGNSTTAGLTAGGNQLWHQNSPGIIDTCEHRDSFGTELAVGDFDRNGKADLAIGVFSEDIGTIRDAGAVNVLYGLSATDGLTSTGNELWTQADTSFEASTQPDVSFGWSVAGGDFNGDGYDELAIGAPGHSISGRVGAGVLHVLFGSEDGLYSKVGGNPVSQFIFQDLDGIADSCETNDQFAYSLLAGDFDSDGKMDIAIGVPNESLGMINRTGAVHVLRGQAGVDGDRGGLTTIGSQFWNQDSPGILDACEDDEGYGGSLG